MIRMIYEQPSCDLCEVHTAIMHIDTGGENDDISLCPRCDLLLRKFECDPDTSRKIFEYCDDEDVDEEQREEEWEDLVLDLFWEQYKPAVHGRQIRESRHLAECAADYSDGLEALHRIEREEKRG